MMESRPRAPAVEVALAELEPAVSHSQKNATDPEDPGFESQTEPPRHASQGNVNRRLALFKPLDSNPCRRRERRRAPPRFAGILFPRTRHGQLLSMKAGETAVIFSATRMPFLLPAARAVNQVLKIAASTARTGGPPVEPIKKLAAYRRSPLSRSVQQMPPELEVLCEGVASGRRVWERTPVAPPTRTAFDDG